MIITPDDYSNAQWERKPHGSIILDGQEVATTLQCCHCGKHFVSIRGSGMKRGFCMKCMQVTCGDTACNPCRPLEKWIEQEEKKIML